uniref:Death domain-containing protein n=1 Tax=Strongyloides papillosus TaxID=174720 RepID=A0A0N5BLX1_STREA
VTQLLEFCGDIHDFVSQKGEKLLEKVMNDDLMKLVHLWTPDKKRTVGRPRKRILETLIKETQKVEVITKRYNLRSKGRTQDK